MNTLNTPSAGQSAQTDNDITGLTSAEVAQRVAEGKVNENADVKTRTIPRIFRDNICTLFNLVNVILAVAIFWTGSCRNLLFLVIILCNVVIGIFQEVRSKMTIDRLSVVTATKAHVIRDGQQINIPLNEIVLDDIVVLGRGDQVPSDCVVISGKCSANESLLTGESDLVAKKKDDVLMSGSFVSAGNCKACVTAVGADNYATKINNAAKVFRRVRSDIMESLNKIIRIVTILLFPIGAALVIKEMTVGGGTLQTSILHTSAALVGMIPQGLILLTSAVLAVSVIRLAQHKVLVQELYCVETLARVDVVCLDKTGTITTGEMDVDEVIPFSGVDYDEALHALIALDEATDDHNETAKALHEYVQNLHEPSGVPAAIIGNARIVPFSSEHKYSGVCFGSEAGNYAIGAAEFVLKNSPRLDEARDAIKRLAGVRRVIVLAKVDDFDDGDSIMGNVEPLAFVFIKDRIRTTAKQTLKYFQDQGVRINIISGDAVETVSNIAQTVGVPDADKCVDMSTVSDDEIERVAKECRVFGRVSPKQKKQLVEALQKQGHTVAMTGDGVNDVLALHTADCSVAMGSGSDAARSVANLVLLDDDFASMPHVVAEGRRSINNLQRSGSLFLVKTIFSAVMSLMFIAIVVYNYPFMTIQLSLIDFFAIGLPSFVLALEPNHDLVRGQFLRNVVRKAIPGAVCIVSAVAFSVVFSYVMGLSQEQFSTMCVILTSVSGLNLIIRLSIPYNPIRTALLIVIIIGLFLGIFVFGGVFLLVPLTTEMAIMTAILAAVITVLFNLLFNYAIVREKRYLARIEAE